MHPLALSHMGGANGIANGDRVRHLPDGRTGVMDEALPDGDAFVTWGDGSFATVKWNNLEAVCEKNARTEMDVCFMPQLSCINQIQIPDYAKILKPGWDGYDGVVPTAEAMTTARCMSLVPGGDGSLQFEIQIDGVEVAIHIGPDGKIYEVFTTGV